MSDVLTAEQAREHLKRLGIPISVWARRQGFSQALVYQVLSGKKKGERGQTHQIMVALGMKKGDIGDVEDLPHPMRLVRRRDGGDMT